MKGTLGGRIDVVVMKAIAPPAMLSDEHWKPKLPPSARVGVERRREKCPCIRGVRFGVRQRYRGDYIHSFPDNTPSIELLRLAGFGPIA